MRFSIRTPVWTRSTRNLGSLSVTVPMYHGTTMDTRPGNAAEFAEKTSGNERGLRCRFGFGDGSDVVICVRYIAEQRCPVTSEVERRRVFGIFQRGAIS